MIRKIIALTFLTFIFSCKSSRIYTTKEKENIRITDSIANTHIQDRIIDFQEDYE